MDGQQLGQFLAQQFRSNNVARGYVTQMRGKWRLVIHFNQPPGVAPHTSSSKARAEMLAEMMRKTRELRYSHWMRRRWTVKDVAAARKILVKAKEITPGRYAKWVE